MKIGLSFVLLWIGIFSNAGLSAQKNVVLIVPDASTHNAFYKEFKTELKKNNKINISEFNNYATWIDIKNYHGETDSLSANERHGYYKGSNIQFYIEVFQNKESIDVYKNEVFLYADSLVYEFKWLTKKGEINASFLRYNLQKVMYCIENNIKQKDLVIVTFNNAIREQNTREDFDKFPDSFVNYVKSQDKEIASKYSFNPLFSITKDNANGMDLDGNYDVQMDITVRQEGEQHVKVLIELKHYPLTDAPRFNKTIRYQKVLDDFSSAVARQFIEQSRSWLLKD